MRDYYEAELRLLHDSALEFARAYPEQAGMLNLSEVKDRDPYIERLLEGMAYLTAQIRQHIDDDIPEISETLLNQLWPHFLRPFPSASVVNFTPRIGQLQQSQLLQKGTVLLTSPVGDERVICRFRTTTDVKLNPMRIIKLDMQESVGGGTVLTLTFQMDSGLSGNDLDLSNLKLYLHADPSIANWLHHQLCMQCDRVRVLFPDQPTRKAHEYTGLEMIKPAHLNPEDALINMSGRSFHGFHLLQDYFCFREKYMFINLVGLDKVDWPYTSQTFQVEFKIKGICPSDHNLRKENFLLHCAPVVNLFNHSSEPIHLSHRRSSYPVVAETSAREGMQVYSLDQVIGIDAETGERHKYYPMHTFQHRKKGGRYFQTQRQKLGNGRTDTYISVGGKTNYRTEMLSCTVTGCNGSYPRRYLKENDIRTPSVDFPSYAAFSNITRPTAMLEPPERARFQWDLISHLSLNYNSLTNKENLQRMLTLYDWTNNEQNRRRIEGIKDIEVKAVDRIKRGALMRGLDIKLTLHEDHYRSKPDIYLFGQILHHFFSMYVAMNCFVQTRVLCHPSNEELTWEPLVGENSPI